ncbi:hypothetical protein CMUS01_04620 [Colletotrichum musicola]|uniref:Uncharacterized protein n=1 Tax=Colletotrichum musicola TaxID=2175873 RepID=A0A8H6KVL5_9PEZI|nr:hypothetical protein CMUS01_04620 [Colletotrichum musicola]
MLDEASSDGECNVRRCDSELSHLHPDALRTVPDTTSLEYLDPPTCLLASTAAIRAPTKQSRRDEQQVSMRGSAPTMWPRRVASTRLSRTYDDRDETKQSLRTDRGMNFEKPSTSRTSTQYTLKGAIDMARPILAPLLADIKFASGVVGGVRGEPEAFNEYLAKPTPVPPFLAAHPAQATARGA